MTTRFPVDIYQLPLINQRSARFNFRRNPFRLLLALANAAEDHLRADHLGDIVITGERLKELLRAVDRLREPNEKYHGFRSSVDR